MARILSGSLALVAVLWTAEHGHGQAEPPPDRAAAELDALVAHALATNPSISAARDRAEAARAAVGSAGALTDPMLSAGIMNLPLSDARSGNEMMTMTTIGIGQTLPFPGRLALQRRVAEHELAAAEARARGARLTVVREVKDAYYELAFLDRALEIVGRNERLLGTLVEVTAARYGVGGGDQSDVLKARVEAARLGESAVSLIERRGAALARLNAALDRPSATPVPAPAVPERLARAAVPESPEDIRFASSALGSRTVGSPLPELGELQDAVVRQNPELAARAAEVAAGAARVELARTAHLPDLNLSIQYGQRGGASDLISAMISVPLPIHRAGRQDLAVTEAVARLSALQAERRDRLNAIRAEVAAVHADLERDRAQLALFVSSILPHARAALESATASFQVGRVDFLTLLESQATVYDYESQYHRVLAGFAERVATLERLVGGEVL